MADEQGKLILVVDDFADIREAYCHFLSARKFRVAMASDGSEALSKAADLQPDLILMDLSLPEVDGWEAISRLRKDKRTKHIPVIVSTAYGVEGARAVIRERCEGFLTKPTPLASLLAEVVRVLQRESVGRDGSA